MILQDFLCTGGKLQFSGLSIKIRNGMKLYISDLHFYDEKLMHQMDNRDFPDVRAMNQHMMEKWNSKVKGGDQVIVLGDLFCTKNPDEVNWILKRLSGKICLVEGNHDGVWLKKEGVDIGRFEWIKSYAEFDDHGFTVIASHYPVFCYNHQHVRKSDGSHRTYMLYGHVHNSYDELLVNRFQEITRQTVVTNAQNISGPIPCHMINCFCMFSGYEPLSLEEWIEADGKRRALIRQEGV